MPDSHRLAAALAVEARGASFYGRPLQTLAPGVRLIDHILIGAKRQTALAAIVLGISEGVENVPFMSIARRHGVSYVFACEYDVLSFLIECSRAVKATDIVRVTPNCPFPAWELLPEAWNLHLADQNDITFVKDLPDGMQFEIFRVETLLRFSSHPGGVNRRTQGAAGWVNFACERPAEFRVGSVEPPAEWRRPELRLTIDEVEDLIVCRSVYHALKERGPVLPIGEIVRVLERDSAIRAQMTGGSTPYEGHSFNR
jgi:spore coat polysaccharide biosynthesis protein SpsF